MPTFVRNSTDANQNTPVCGIKAIASIPDALPSDWLGRALWLRFKASQHAFHSVVVKTILTPVTVFAAIAGAVCPLTALAQSAVWTNRSVAGPSSRADAAMCFDSARNVSVLFGGVDPAVRNDTWEWNGTAWTQRVVAGPSARANHAMAYDSIRNVVVLFGGSTGADFPFPPNTYLGDTWEWNGVSWTQRAVSGPSARAGHAMVFDPVRGVIVLFGGLAQDSWRGDTWEFNGTAWSLSSMAFPSQRIWPAMAYDTARSVITLFGGHDVFNHDNHTWTRVGTQWGSQILPGPLWRQGSTMTFDANRQVCVMFGGELGDFDHVYSDQTWEHDGAGWIQREIPARPTARRRAAMTYDSGRGVSVLFGGLAASLAGDTWEYGVPCAAPATPASLIRCASQSATFTTTSRGGLAPTFQWRKNGVNIPGATAVSYTIASVQASDAGAYDCITASQTCGSAATAQATLDVRCECPGPTVIQGGVIDDFTGGNGAEPAAPRSVFLNSAQTFFSTSAPNIIEFDVIPPMGSSNFRYFLHSFTGIPADATSASLTLRVRASSGGSTTTDDTVRIGQATSTPGSISSFYTNGVGDSVQPPTSWSNNSAGTMTLNLASLPAGLSGPTNLLPQMSANGFLDLIVENRTGVDYATLTITRAATSVYPWVQSQPVSQEGVCLRSPVTFSIAGNAAGAPFTYQWQKDSVNIPGATASTFSIGAVNAFDTGMYRCIVTNSCGSAISNTALLSSCVADFNCDSGVDFFDYLDFVDAFSLALITADITGDLIVDFFDYLDFVDAFSIGC